MGCEREIDQEEIEETDRTSQTWKIREKIKKCPIGKLTVDELILIVNTFKPEWIETLTNFDMKALIRIQRKLRPRSTGK